MDDSRTLFVGNLGPEVTEALLRELFLQAGPIEKVRLMFVNGMPKPFAHVIYQHESSVHYATDIFRGTQLHKRELLLQQNNAPRDSGQSHFTPPRLNNSRDERNENPSRSNQYRDERNTSGNHYRNETPSHGNHYRDGRNEFSSHGNHYRDERDDRSRGNHYREDRNERPPRGNHYRDDRSERHSRGHHYRDERSERSSHGQHHSEYTYG